ncbi:aldehyde dehydrogenase family protein [Sphingobium estronivorans]|uniref:aldehyde dehydrogenase family protein n=1 Tax=Sphingobium estronivorans TaxID=1577690 RepID=UPI00123C341E|nr:aldehyde dehydrogenase family protein [Sphingobium estronivorans]
MDFDRDYSMTINGGPATAASWLDVVNPATGKAFAQVPDCTSEQLDEAVSSAQAAFPQWRALPLSDRQALLLKAADAIEPHVEALVRLFTREQGRSTAGARLEIEGAVQWLRAVSRMAPPEHVVEDSTEQLIRTRYVPLGVICAIAPWNFPVTLSIWKIAPALLAGNTMVLKPSPFTPLCTLKIAELLRDVLPAGVLNVVCGGDNLGVWMTSHPGFAKISFTGSTATGKRVMEAASRDLKRVTLELGGNDAAIVMPDVDVDAVAEKIFNGAFYNSAQICVATKRLYVHADVYDRLRDRLVELAQAAKVGDGSQQGVTLGPIQNARQWERVRELLADAREKGLTLLQGGDVPEEGFFIPVTIVDNPPEHERVVQEEAFGPILPMLKFQSVDEVIDRANASDYGLAGAVWSADEDAAMSIAERIETGTVWINQNLVLRPDTPFAGRKQSGLGVENGMEGLLEFMAPQAIYLARS